MFIETHHCDWMIFLYHFALLFSGYIESLCLHLLPVFVLDSHVGIEFSCFN